MPQPQRFTELYFSQPSQLPTSTKTGDAQKLSFSVHNREHQTITYRYRLTALSTNNALEHHLRDGMIRLAHDQTGVISQTVVLPALGSRVGVKTTLEYMGRTPGSSMLSLQTQSIHYWVATQDAPADSKGNNEHR